MKAKKKKKKVEKWTKAETKRILDKTFMIVLTGFMSAALSEGKIFRSLPATRKPKTKTPNPLFKEMYGAKTQNKKRSRSQDD